MIRTFLLPLFGVWVCAFVADTPSPSVGASANSPSISSSFVTAEHFKQGAFFPDIGRGIFPGGVK
eukprot:CAMPEP_0194329676 /NCGR_PEP_ID=MMETSP0171-20130528/49038_1 /TAXON_ID=218684 /ORGANISM="Corethron pennatum, Strain L29A3" /LENGTH=64 /DNA_ID=CAMNT_0039090471 /DNA_START=323 /DNA_END=517 /DNA_ORIENTATION=-